MGGTGPGAGTSAKCGMPVPGIVQPGLSSVNPMGVPSANQVSTNETSDSGYISDAQNVGSHGVDAAARWGATNSRDQPDNPAIPEASTQDAESYSGERGQSWNQGCSASWCAAASVSGSGASHGHGSNSHSGSGTSPAHNLDSSYGCRGGRDGGFGRDNSWH